MRRIVASMMLSLDGVMEAPETWAFPYLNDEADDLNRQGMAASDAMLLGRKTYQEFAAFWPHQSGWIADYINATPKFVVSSTLDTVDWQNSTLIRGDLVEELTRLQRQPGQDITIVGSATLFQSVLRAGRLDELTVMVIPILIGGGKRLFADEGDPKPLQLKDAKTFSTGVLALTYQPASG